MKGDVLVERGAARLQELSRKAAAKGGFAAKLADELAEDAVFLRKLKPSLIKARARGQAPVASNPDWRPEPQAPAKPDWRSEPQAPSAPQMSSPRPPNPNPKPKRRRTRKRSGGGPNPFLVGGIALAAGIALAKVIDWRGHAHPRD
jgi:hypothetical protein